MLITGISGLTPKKAGAEISDVSVGGTGQGLQPRVIAGADPEHSKGKVAAAECSRSMPLGSCTGATQQLLTDPAQSSSLPAVEHGNGFLDSHWKKSDFCLELLPRQMERLSARNANDGWDPCGIRAKVDIALRLAQWSTPLT